jgi:membrane-associated protease RseP (regulator of RpoE activity)
MGISSAPFGIKIEDMDYLPKLVTHPLGAEHDDKGLAVRLLRFVALPTLGYSPVVSPATELYEPSGVFSGVPSDVYWVLVNVFYWLFWANLLLGIANALPALPFDGGFVLRDALKRAAHWRAVRITGFERAIGKKALADWQIDQLMWVISAFVYLLLVFIITWQVVGPVF